jgi:hypothetical protein
VPFDRVAYVRVCWRLIIGGAIAGGAFSEPRSYSLVPPDRLPSGPGAPPEAYSGAANRSDPNDRRCFREQKPLRETLLLLEPSEW